VSHLREFGTPVWILLQGQQIQHKMLPKLQRRVLVRFDDGSKSVKFYNASTRSILTLRNYKFLTLSDPSLPEEVAIKPPGNKGETNLSNDKGEDAPSKGEEGRGGDTWSATQKGADKPNKEMNTKKRSADMDINPCELQRTRGIKKDYRYLHNPFPDEEEAGIACIDKDEAYVVVPDDKCRSLRQAKGSEDWEEWEHGSLLKNPQEWSQ